MLKIIIVACLFLSACAMVGPHYQEPQKKIADHWLNKNSSVIKAVQKHDCTLDYANWWDVFHDSTLNSLVYQGYKNNLSLQSAGVHILQARAQLAQVVGELYPQQQALIGNLNYNRIGGSSLQDILPSSFDTALLGASVNWELDFWGKYRRSILANDAMFIAAYAAYDNNLVALSAGIATAYINIRSTQALILVTKQNIKVQALGLKIAQSRFNAGESSLLDVEQAQTELSKTQSKLPEYFSELQHQKDLLAVLLSMPPDSIEPWLKAHRSIPQAPTAVIIGIPKETIVQRPDIYQARMEAIAQLETIGSIQANLYPSLTLAGTFALASNNISPNSLGNIFNWANRTAIAGPALNWPILNYGQISNAVRVQDAVFQQALLNYQNLVLQAQAEVQDSITAFIESKKSEFYLIKANRSAIKSTQLAIIRYREGESDYTPVLDAERQQLQVQTSLTKIQGEIPKTLIALYKALGGGWQIRKHNDVISAKIKSEMAARTHWANLLQTQSHSLPQNKKAQLKERYLPKW